MYWDMYKPDNDYTKLDFTEAQELSSTLPKKGDSEAAAHDQVGAPQTKKEQRKARIAAGENPYLWANMNKGQKAAMILGAIGASFTAYANPELGWKQAMRATGKAREWETKQDVKQELELERAHELTKIEATVAGQLKVQDLSGTQAAERLDTTIAADTSALDRQLEASATAQQNELNFRGDQALLDFGFQKFLRKGDREHDVAMQAGSLAGQTSIALLQEQFARQEELRGYLHAQFGAEGMMYAEEILSQAERYAQTGEFAPWSLEAVEQIEIAGKTRSLKMRQEEESARLAIYGQAKELIMLSSPAGQTAMDPNGPEMQRIVSVVGGINSLVAPAEASVAIASLKTSQEGQQLLDNFVQLSGRTELPSGQEVGILSANIAQMPVPLNPLVAREMFFSVGANFDDVNASTPLPEGAAALDFSETDPEAARQKRLYWEPVGAALEQADILSTEFGRVLRVWHDKHQTGNAKSDYAMIWRMIKNYQGFDDTFRASLMDELAGGRRPSGRYTKIGMPTPSIRR